MAFEPRYLIMKPAIFLIALILSQGLGVVSAESGLSEAESQLVAQHSFEIGENDFLLDGKPLQIRCGEIHSSRVPRAYWQHRLKMCKAMGLNTVCAYLFWNYHERSQDEFTWEDQADVVEFCKLAQAEGLWVILRPGPYACAEWEMGGLPWWLLKHEDIQLRSRDPRFISAARNYLQEVGRVLGPMQVTNGGPILMVQVENEYGFYGNDGKYMGEIRQAIIDAGFDVPLFSCNPVQHLKRGYNKDLFPVVNFGSNPEGGFKALREILPKGPLMCGEYYSGWFDTWGSPHHTGDTDRYLTDLEYMLKNNASFSIYMAHGGTSFGLWAGADRPFKPDTSCYDYDAPISESGRITEKFTRSRELMGRYLQAGETLPSIPEPKPSVTFSTTKLTKRSGLLDKLSKGISVKEPEQYEKHDLPQGCMLYRKKLAAGPAGVIRFAAVHDAGWVTLDGKPIGVLDRRKKMYSVNIPAREVESELDILVEAMGRVNFGVEVHDRKGLHGPVTFESSGSETIELTDWQMFKLPLDEKMLNELVYHDLSSNTSGPAFYQGVFSVESVGDTFIDLSNWGKGVLWVNGRCLGRYWNIGPAQTLYVPGVWLEEGKNEVVILDLLGPTEPTIAGLEKPILSKLRPELDFAGSGRANKKLNLSDDQMVAKGQFQKGDRLQTITFDKPISGRYFCLESLSAHDGKRFAGVAELDLLDQSGEAISHEGWLIAYVSSEERLKEDGMAENAIDGQTANHWHTEWSQSKVPNHPHRLVIDLGTSKVIKALQYAPRTGDKNTNGRIKEFQLYVGDELVTE